MKMFLVVVLAATAAWGQSTYSGGAVMSGGALWASLSVCGPPAYGCSRSDLTTVQIPPTLPNVGGLTGANLVVSDPDFGNRIVRITDAGLDPSQADKTVSPSCGGAQGDMTWNTNSTLLVVCNTGGRSYPMSFTPATMQASLLYVGSIAFPNGMYVGNSLSWSRANPYLGYVLAGTQIQGYCFADMVNGTCPAGGPLDAATPPSSGNGRIFTVYDFASSNSCLGSALFPEGFTPDWTNWGQPSAGDASFTAAWSYDISGTANVTNGSTTVTWASGENFDARYNSGNIILGGVSYGVGAVTSSTAMTIGSTYSGTTGTVAFTLKGVQGTGVNVTVYVPGSGCTMLNTETGVVTSDFGPGGTLSIPDRWSMHDAFSSAGTSWAYVGFTTCVSTSCPTKSGTLPYFWQIGTTTVTGCNSGGGCSGHYTEAAGYSHFINNGTNPWQDSFNLRAFASPNGGSGSCFYSCGGSVTPPGLAPPWDNHPSWNNVDAHDSVPFVTSSYSAGTNQNCSATFTFALECEIFAVNPVTGAVARFAHNFITSKSQTFIPAQGIGQVSQDGRFFMFGSDWMGSLGSTSGAAACTVGTDCRGDVFVVELR